MDNDMTTTPTDHQDIVMKNISDTNINGAAMDHARAASVVANVDLIL